MRRSGCYALLILLVLRLLCVKERILCSVCLHCTNLKLHCNPGLGRPSNWAFHVRRLSVSLDCGWTGMRLPSYVSGLTDTARVLQGRGRTLERTSTNSLIPL